MEFLSSTRSFGAEAPFTYDAKMGWKKTKEDPKTIFAIGGDREAVSGGERTHQFVKNATKEKMFEAISMPVSFLMEI